MHKRLGLFGARADNTGLATQTKGYFDYLHPDKTLLLDLRSVNKEKGKITPFRPELFPDAIIHPNFPSKGVVDEFLKDLDTVMAVETPYSYYLFERAKDLGIKSFLVINYEFLDYLAHPEWAKPDVLLVPSLWHFEEVESLAKELGMEAIYLPVPIDRRNLPFKQRYKATSFLHIAGHKTYMDRNGTDIVYECLPYIQNDDVTVTIRSQHHLPYSGHRQLKIETQDALNYWDNYKQEDVLLLPRQYGGLSLQLNEAMSVGMIPLMPDVEPQSLFLPSDCLLPVTDTRKGQTRTTIDVFDVSPKDLAAAIDRLSECESGYLKFLSDSMNDMAAMWSWDSMYEEYKKVLGL